MRGKARWFYFPGYAPFAMTFLVLTVLDESYTSAAVFTKRSRKVCGLISTLKISKFSFTNPPLSWIDRNRHDRVRDSYVQPPKCKSKICAHLNPSTEGFTHDSTKCSVAKANNGGGHISRGGRKEYSGVDEESNQRTKRGHTRRDSKREIKRIGRYN